MQDMAGQPDSERFVVNCASQEYFLAVKNHLKCPVYNMQFPGRKTPLLPPLPFGRGARPLLAAWPCGCDDAQTRAGPSVYAKQARGAMVRHIVISKAKAPEDLKSEAGFASLNPVLTCEIPATASCSCLGRG